MKQVRRAVEVTRTRGLRHVLREVIPHVYNSYVWPCLPKTDPVKLAGVPVSSFRRERDRLADPDKIDRHRLFDHVVPWETPSNCDSPGYEGPLLTFLESAVERGDDVVVVGGGYGVSSVLAARAVGDSGSVTTYEASAERIADLEETVEMNGVEARVTLYHAIVGTDVHVIGDAGDATVTAPSELPECDVLELDCEGAELAILRALLPEFTPREIVVEAHACFDAPASEVTELLEEHGYRIVDEGVEVEDQGILVLHAVHEDS